MLRNSIQDGDETHKQQERRDYKAKYNICAYYTAYDRLCGLVVRVLGYRFGGPGFDSQALQDFPTKKKKENK
jgi:hypothetical protein